MPYHAMPCHANQFWPWVFCYDHCDTDCHPIHKVYDSSRRIHTQLAIPFKDWRFLAMAFLLGVACTYVYIESGSLWLAAATHAVPVWSWLLLLGRPGDLKELTKRL